MERDANATRPSTGSANRNRGRTEADKAKTVYYVTCYKNGKGEQGPWSPIVEAVIV